MRSPRSVTSAARPRPKSSSLVGELALRRSLIDVRVPAADVGEGDLEPDVRLRQLRDLSERLPERRARIVGAAFGPVAGRIRAFQHPDRVERLASGAVQHTIGRRGELALEGRRDRVARLAAADPELFELIDRQRRRGALEHAGQLLRQRDRAKRRRPLRRGAPEGTGSASRPTCS